MKTIATGVGELALLLGLTWVAVFCGIGALYAHLRGLVALVGIGLGLAGPFGWLGVWLLACLARRRGFIVAAPDRALA